MSLSKDDLWLFFLFSDCFCLLCGDPKPSDLPECQFCHDLMSLGIKFNGIEPLGDADGELV